MTAPRLRLVQEASAEVVDLAAGTPIPAPAAPPASFTRVVSTPAAWPWRQRQAAELDARCGSPLPPDQVTYQLTRLDPWRNGHGARFTITYARGGPGRAGGRRAGGAVCDLLSAVLPSRAAVSDARPHAGLLVLLIHVAAIILFTFSAVTALGRRADTAADLTALQRRAIVAERRAVDLAAARRQARALLTLGVRDRSPERVLQDMAWVSRHAASTARIQAFHWRRGVSAVEVESPDPPFTDPDRTVQRASRPIGPGVWLWGVVAATATSNDAGERR